MISFERVRDLELIELLFWMFRVKKGFIFSFLTVGVTNICEPYIDSFSKGLHCCFSFLVKKKSPKNVEWLKNAEFFKGVKMYH